MQNDDNGAKKCEVCGVTVADLAKHNATQTHQKKVLVAQRKAEKEAAKMASTSAAAAAAAPAPETPDTVDKGCRSRAWCFTINNFTEADEEKLRALDCEYLVYGREHLTVGTPHIQGYVYFASARTLSVLKKKVHATAHFEPSHGSPSQNKAYCTKEDTEFFEKGQIPSPGARTDISEMKAAVKAGATMQQLIDQSESYQSLKTAELLLKYQPMPPPRPQLRVHWFYGSTGTGKTHTAFAEAGTADTWVSGKTLQWWQGYSGQKNIIIDDMRGDFCEFHTFLRYLDIYPIQVEYKGASTWLRAENIYITTPMKPEDLYRSRTTEDIAQLLRRIHDVREFTTPYVPSIAARVDLTPKDFAAAYSSI